MNEHYHSVNGAIAESMHVFIQNGLQAVEESDSVNIFEIGFGTGLNSILTAIEAAKMNMKVSYYTIEKYPLKTDIVMLLNYGNHPLINSTALSEMIHKAAWNKIQAITQWFNINKIEADLTEFDISLLPDINLVFFDAFGPDKQPEMWKTDIFNKLYEIMADRGILVTYSAKGEIRRILTKTGFYVEKLPGPPGKREMLRGTKNFSG